jgi:hypothetical protein
LVRLGSYYAGGLGLPTAVVSEDLRYLCPLYVDASIPEYNHFVSVEIWGATIAAATGREWLVFNSDDVKEALSGEPILNSLRSLFG